jgi:imidazolonepropionase-like amidohydrolase
MKGVLLVPATAWVVLAVFAASVAAQDLVITNARVITGTGQVIERGSVVVRNGRIASVGAGAAAAPGTQAIDVHGMTVMPGFIDGHRHIIRGESGQWLKTEAADRMREFLEAGFTTLLEGGGRIPDILELKKRIDSGQLKGPRIIASARADPASFKTAEQARARVQEIVKAGVEFVKASITPQATPEEVALLTAVADEARRHKTHLMVHAVSPKAMAAAVKAGSTKLVHTPHNGYLKPEEARLVRDAGIENLSTIGFGVPVFGVFNKDNVPTFRDGKPWPSGIIDSAGDGREAGEKAVNGRMLWDNGVVYGFGTDTSYHPRDGLAHELRALNLMFSPIDLVRLMGPNSAAFVERSQEIGTLEPGKLADMVVLDGNPLEGYWHLLNARLVIKGGEVVVDTRQAVR